MSAYHPPEIDPRYSWYGLPDHPDKPEREELPDGEMEDLVEYLYRAGEFWSQHPPTAPPGFWLVPCDNTPRHGPEYVPIDTDFYEPGCSRCQYASLSAAHNGCEHSHHGRWRRWKATHKVIHWLSRAHLIKGHGIKYGGGCRGCEFGIKFGIRRESKSDKAFRKLMDGANDA